ncbi:MAG: adenine phosphoribosyltransferase [Chloroflexi bacterium]|nr:adenine phosphoribosyltransferase [Chloroflexota bacterium]GIW10907.1 MAG: adenine phosphoribosyltransferase [Dehalococcoidia bacterium]
MAEPVWWHALIRDIPDFPQPGVVFKDITPILRDPHAFREAVTAMTDPWRNRGIDRVVGVESRGFIFAAPIALQLGAGFVPVRKLGKLPHETISQEYTLEYGTATLEIHKDGIRRGERVLVVDDLLATGGTIQATAQLVELLGGHVVGVCFLVELDFLQGRQRLRDREVVSIIHC